MDSNNFAKKNLQFIQCPMSMANIKILLKTGDIQRLSKAKIVKESHSSLSSFSLNEIHIREEGKRVLRHGSLVGKKKGEK